MNFPKHLFSLDIARGVAAIAVVFWHWQHFFSHQYTLGEEFDRTQQPLYSLFSLFYDKGNLAVPFFFELSGFVFFWLYLDKVSARDCSAYKFAVLRFARLYPLHIATLLIVAALQAIHARVVGGSFIYSYNDSYHFLLHLFFASHWGLEEGYSFNAPIWSVSIEIGLYCCFFLYCIAKVQKTTKLIAILIGTFLLLKLGIGVRWTAPAHAFFIGGLTYELTRLYLSNRTKFSDNFVLCTAIVAWIGVITSHRIEYWLLSTSNNSLVFLFPLTIISLVVAEMRFPDFPKRAAWIGDLTYASYLLHFPLQLTFVLFFFTLGYDNSVFLSVPVLALFFLLLTALSLIVHQRFERPMQYALRSVLLSKATSEPSDAPESASRRVSTMEDQLRRPGDR